MAAYTAIDDPEAYFQTKTYTGNNTDGLAITFDGDTDMSPNLIWFKVRSHAHSSCIADTVRGISDGGTKVIHSDLTNAETTCNASTGLKTADSDGFTLGAETSTSGSINGSSKTYVAWCWKETADAGFDIVSYTGDGSQGRDLSHSLSAVPAVMLIKNREGTTDWRVYHHKNTAAPATDYLELNTTDATADDDSTWNDTDPTSSVFTVKSSTSVNGSDTDYIAYLFTEKQGFSKFGTYEGRNNANGTFVYTGFSVAFVMVKNIDASGPKWVIQDTKRSPSGGGNPAEARLHPNDTTAEEADSDIDLLSNGFKIRSTGSYTNDAETYIYIAFAEAPFVNSNGVPCNAR